MTKYIQILIGMLGVFLIISPYSYANTDFVSSSALKKSNSIIENTALNLTPPPPPVLNVHGYYLIDVNSSKVLGMQNPDQKMPPASLTKLMTLYLTFEALNANRIHLTDLVPISEHAWKTEGSRMFLKVNDHVLLSDLIRGVIVDSGNDACVALAEFIGGSENNFAALMNAQAKLLNMKNTHYIDSTGLPNPEHYTTPRDLAILAQAIINNFPGYYAQFAEKTFTFNHITQPNRNRLLWRDASVDGLKTGHTDAAGYCLIASAKRNNMRLLSVVLGAPTDHERADFSEALLNYGFHFFETHKVYSADQSLKMLPVYGGAIHTVSSGPAEDVYITTPMGQYKNVSFNITANSPLKAPIQKYQKVGTITAVLNNKNILQINNNQENIDLVALSDIQKGNIFRQAIDKIKLLFHHAG